MSTEKIIMWMLYDILQDGFLITVGGYGVLFKLHDGRPALRINDGPDLKLSSVLPDACL